LTPAPPPGRCSRRPSCWPAAPAAGGRLHLRQDDVEPERLLAARAAVELRLAVGVPAQGIVGALGDADVAMVVLGVRGHPAGPRAASSIALAVANHAIKPVVVVPEPRDPPPAGLHRVLVPLDGIPDAVRAVDQAVRWFAGSASGS
jgi:hypothetical protein